MSIKPIGNGKYLLSFWPDGRKGKFVRKRFNSAREARQYQKNYKTETQNDKKLRLVDLIEYWYINHGHSLKSSADTKNRLLIMAQMMGDPLAKDVDGVMFTKYRQQRLNEGIQPSTLNRELSTLKTVYNETKRLGIWSGDIPINPIRKYKVSAHELSYLTDQEILLLLKEVEKSGNPSLKYVTEICLLTGARWSEANGLLHHHLKNDGIYFVKTKNGLNRFVPIPVEDFRRIKNFIQINKGLDPSYSAFRRAFERTGIITPKGQLAHILRHTYASHFMMNGGDILTLQKILGHSSIQMTMRYAHLSLDYLKESLEFNPFSKLKSRID